MTLINCDFDGVLIPNTLEEKLISYAKECALSFADGSPLWDWYGNLVENTTPPINHSLLRYLQSRKEMGDTIRIWTNRAHTLRDATLRTLGPYVSIFDSFQFYSGKKHLSQVEGIVIDNSPQYLSCGERGILYSID